MPNDDARLAEHGSDSNSLEAPTAEEGPRGSWSGTPAPSDDTDPLLGQTLSETYVVKRVLGQGGMGRVYEASHTRIQQKRFAIKVLHAEFAGQPDVLMRFRREAEAAACISNPFVVGVYDIDRTEDGRPYLVCEHLEGVDLGARLKLVGAQPVPVVARIARRVCQGLEAAHKQGVIHRDLKPQNIFLSGNLDKPDVKILDFGLSRFLDGSHGAVTKTGVIMGTPAYMAPEMATGEKVDHRVDVYGVGVILYSALTGRPPFDESSPQKTVIAVMTTEPTRPRTIVPSIPEHLEAIVQRAMAKSADDRYQTVDELYLALAPYEPPETDGAPSAPVDSLPRSMNPTLASLEGEASDVETARPRLVMFALLALGVVVVAVATAVTSVVHLTLGADALSRTELVLILLGIAGTALTPVVLALRRIRRSVWDNSLKVLELVHSMRTPLLGGLAGYGMTALLVRSLEGVGSQFTDASVLHGPEGLAWPGWNALLLAAGAVTAAMLGLQQWLRRKSSGRILRIVFGPGLIASTVLIVLGMVALGFRWRGDVVAPAPTQLVVAETDPMDAPRNLEPTPAEPIVSAAPAPSAAPSADLPSSPAPPGELADALKKGTPALRALSKKYPGDPAILRPLALGLTDKAWTQQQAVQAAALLFRAAPEELRSREMRRLLVKAAESSPEASKAAIELMATGMGSVGPDILYDLMLTSPTVRAEAKDRLAEPAVRAKSSPALRIAYDLRTAETCEARVPLLANAAALGDKRTLTVLSPLSEGRKTGCGPSKRRPCPAKCPEHIQVIRGAIGALNSRLTSGKRR